MADLPESSSECVTSVLVLVMGLEPSIPRTGKVVECVTSLENLQAKIAFVCLNLALL